TPCQAILSTSAATKPPPDRFAVDLPLSRGDPACLDKSEIPPLEAGTYGKAPPRRQARPATPRGGRMAARVARWSHCNLLISNVFHNFRGEMVASPPGTC